MANPEAAAATVVQQENAVEWTHWEVALTAGLIAGGTAFLAVRKADLIAVPVFTVTLGALIAAAQTPDISNWFESSANIFDELIARRKVKQGKMASFILRPISTISTTLNTATEGIPNRHAAIGVRVTLTLLIVEAVVAAVLIGAAIVAAVAISTFLIGVVLSEMSHSTEDVEPASPARGQVSHRYKDAKAGDAIGSTHSVTPLFGEPYQEHRDADENVTHTSKYVKPMFGDAYVETRDADDNVVERSRRAEPLFGEPHVEHRNTDDEVTATSHERDPLFGERYVETQDADGRAVSETREVDPLFGDKFREHRKP